MTKPHLLLLHGATGVKELFDPFIPLLGDYFYLHTFDFEGHGTAPLNNRPLRMEYFAENIAHYMDTHDVPQAFLFGHSMGGYAALCLALQQPERVQKVFTLGTKFAWTPEFAAGEAQMLDPELMRHKAARFVALLEKRHTATPWANHAEAVREMLLYLGENPTLSNEQLAQLQVPVRIGVGDRDKMVTLEESMAVFRALPQGEFQVLPNTPHQLERVMVDWVAEAIQEAFLSK